MKNLSYVEIAKKIREEDILIGKYYVAGEVDDTLPNELNNRDAILEHLCSLAYEVYIESDYYSLETVSAAIRDIIDDRCDEYGYYIVDENTGDEIKISPEDALMQVSLEDVEKAAESNY